MIGSVKAFKLYGGIEVETTLDPKEQPFLYDHQIDGVPLQTAPLDGSSSIRNTTPIGLFSTS
jgi:hypothetical protein